MNNISLVLLKAGCLFATVSLSSLIAQADPAFTPPNADCKTGFSGGFPLENTPPIPEGFRVIRIDELDVEGNRLRFGAAFYTFDIDVPVYLIIGLTDEDEGVDEEMEFDPEEIAVNTVTALNSLIGRQVAVSLDTTNIEIERRIAAVWELPCSVLQER